MDTEMEVKKKREREKNNMLVSVRHSKYVLLAMYVDLLYFV